MQGFIRNLDELSLAPVSGSYDPWLVCGSCSIAVASAYISLLLVSRIRDTQSALLRRHLHLAATVSLGSGVWSMHFVGMLALDMPHEMRYHASMTALSLLVVLAAIHFSLRMIISSHGALKAILLGGFVAGSGIALMHYLGMSAIHTDATSYYRIDLFVISIGLAIAAACLSFWIGVRYLERFKERTKLVALAAAGLMGLAIAGMHYTGMAATVFVPNQSHTQEPLGFTLDRGIVTYLIVALMAIILSISSLVAATDTRLNSRARLGLASLLLAAVGLISGGTALLVIYDASFDLERERLAEGIRMQTQLINAVARFDLSHRVASKDEHAETATLSQVSDAQAQWQGFGRTGESYLVRRNDSHLSYLTKPRLYPDGMPAEILIGSSADVVSLRAATDNANTILAKDYRGAKVLAAYGPVSGVGGALIIKLDMAEFREPFVQAGIAVSLGTCLLIALALWLVRDISAPVIDELQEKQRLEIELDFARQVQEGLLPDKVPTIEGYEFAAKSIPARFVGGDFYDFKMLSDSSAVAIIGDVSGKGVSAALHMARLISDFRHACDSDPRPEWILDSLNRRLFDNASKGMFATAICFLIDCDSHRATIANAGHHSPLLRDNSEQVATIAPPSGPPLGVLEDAIYVGEAYEVSKGDTILLYTDGVVEARDRAENEFGAERLSSLLGGFHADIPSVITTVNRSVSAFSGGRALFDDLTMLTFGRI